MNLRGYYSSWEFIFLNQDNLKRDLINLQTLSTTLHFSLHYGASQWNLVQQEKLVEDYFSFITMY